MRADPDPKLRRSVESPVSAKVVKSRAKQPRRELKTSRLES